MLTKMFCICFIKFSKIIHIFQKYRCFYNLI